MASNLLGASALLNHLIMSDTNASLDLVVHRAALRHYQCPCTATETSNLSAIATAPCFKIIALAPPLGSVSLTGTARDLSDEVEFPIYRATRDLPDVWS